MSIASQNLETNITALHAVPTADASTDVYVRDVVGKKDDAAVAVATTTKSIMAYVKGLLGLHINPSANATTNTNMRDVIGNKTDTAVTAVGTENSIAAYSKGAITLLLQFLAAQRLVPAMASVAGASATYSNVLSISDKGIVTGISQTLYPSAGDAIAGTGSIKIVLDGVTVYDGALSAANFETGVYDGRGQASIAMNHPFSATCLIQYKVSDVKLTALTVVSYTTD